MINKIKTNISNTLSRMNEDVHEVPLGDLYLTSFAYTLFLLLIPKGVAFFVVGMTFGYIWSKAQ